LAELRGLAPAAGATILGANVIDQAHGKRAWAESLLLERGGARVAVFGLVARPTREEAPTAAWREGLAFIEPTAVAQRLAPQLRRGADVVILVTDLDRETLRAVLAKARGIDFVLQSGHASDLTARADRVRGVPVLETLAGGRYVGRLDVTVVKPGKAYADQSERAMLERKIELYAGSAHAKDWRKELRELRAPGNRFIYRLVELSDEAAPPPEPATAE
jgi:2',3'-cyclic-nucleotide 2'-phosphodiesterase (5'-nucleotidase family)